MLPKSVIAHFCAPRILRGDRLYGAEIQLCKMGLSLFCDQNGLDLDELEHSLSSKLILPGSSVVSLATFS